MTRVETKVRMTLSKLDVATIAEGNHIDTEHGGTLEQQSYIKRGLHVEHLKGAWSPWWP